MQFKCVVLLSKANNKTAYASCFRFPKNIEGRKNCLSRIRRKNFEPSDKFKDICQSFEEYTMVREDK